ncbi:class I SAM-dependent methyltransferase [Persicimonas caeni]|uniref:Class I SAM-dependent methyltransferase n=1 Tax=Persicimonas caeni TaxID=2292766 RepID=A0A4Y6PWK6_PERCE|nr:class I SAM-dependent methyltransferase [Persicimonas caeni]QDG52397.1 class I SAM-dependent methyltransferase [Persicimonas caeni]QED33619.1 class I SAM-dependent methyltransferase [Persicimonas caeni]
MATEPLDWNAKYDCRGLLYGHQPNSFLAEHAASLIPRQATILSLGEGEGRNAVWLGRHGWKVCAVDVSAHALAKLHRLAAEAGVDIETRRADVSAFDAGCATYGAVIILHMHLPPEARRQAHRRAINALAPGGVLLLEALRPEQLEQPSSGPTAVECLYTADELAEDFAPLQIKYLGTEDRDIRAGQHQGITSVVSLIGRKPG